MVFDKRIGMIGGGNMGQAILNGFLLQGIPAAQIVVADHTQAHCDLLRDKFSVTTTTDNKRAVSEADIVLLAVKPQQLKAVLQGIQPVVSQQLIVSIAAGITTQQIKQWLQRLQQPVIRAMPNTPALIQMGMTALFASSEVTDDQKQSTEHLMRILGQTVWLEQESQMHAVTALSGSGPAYFFYFFESLIQAGTKLGLTNVQAAQLVLQTAQGSIQMAKQQPQALSQLRAQVTSKGGTTECGIQTLLQGGFAELIEQAIAQASARSEVLSQEQT